MPKRSRRSRSRRYGAPASEHAARSSEEIQSIRRLEKQLRANIAIGDCVRSAGIMRELARKEGQFETDRLDSGRGRGRIVPSVHLLFTKFVRACIRPAMPRSSRR